ncbi:MAG: DUF4395 domain-containing protein, partial [Acidimicrobiia bacterium]|nr:DUF4395 domain-containing protein [Acidimicrobiia bacterium]
MTRPVDHAALRTNQAFIIGLLALAFVVDLEALVVFVAAVMAIGTIWPRLGLFQAIYRGVLRDRLIKPDVLHDNPEPHRFSQGFGAVVLGVALILFSSGWAAAAWSVVGVVVLLASINLFAGFCAGCFLYYWLARLEA